MADLGCACHGCGERFRIDVYVSAAVWQQIGMSGPGGLLCGRCIVDRLEAGGVVGAFVLSSVADVEDAVSASLGSDWRLAWLPGTKEEVTGDPGPPIEEVLPTCVACGVACQGGSTPHPSRVGAWLCVDEEACASTAFTPAPPVPSPGEQP